MLKRTSSLAFAVVVAGGIGMLTSKQAHSQLGVFKNDVGLQATTPGTAQSGHSNITGTSRAGSFAGSGAGLTGLNASNISSGVLSDARLSGNVALQNAANTFSATNTFNGLTQMNGFVGVNIGTGSTFETRFQVHDPSTSGYGGMYVSTADAGAWPFYGYATGGSIRGWTYYNGTDDHWKLSLAGTDWLAASNTGRFAFGAGVTEPTDLTYAFFVNNGAPDGIRIRNEAANADSMIFLDGGGNFSTITAIGATDTLQIANDSSALYFSETGHFGINTSIPTGSEGFTVEGPSEGGFGGIVARVPDATSGLPFYGYSNGSDYMWTYFDSATNEWRVYHGGDRIRLSETGELGLRVAPTPETNFSTATLASESGFRDGINATVRGTGTPYAIWARSLDLSGSGNAVRGEEISTNPLAFGVYAVGNLGASGTKSFMIDHPLDPTNAYLKHYSTESPTPQNTYNGSVVTDGSGLAWVNLPDYFGEINVNFRYQLTVVDESEDFVMAKVSKRIANNRFQIRTSKPGVEVSWQVTADRNDKYVQREGAPDVVEKPDMFKGTYLDPLSWGVPAEQGQEFRRGQLAQAETERINRSKPKFDPRSVQKPRVRKPATRDRG